MSCIRHCKQTNIHHVHAISLTTHQHTMDDIWFAVLVVHRCLSKMEQLTFTMGTPISVSSRLHSSLCCCVTLTVRLLYLAMSSVLPVCMQPGPALANVIHTLLGQLASASNHVTPYHCMSVLRALGLLLQCT